MAVERRSLSLNSVLTTLEIPCNQRKQVDLENILKYAYTFKFFQDLLERQSNPEMLLELAKVITPKTFYQDETVFSTGDNADFFYFIVRGQVKIMSNIYVEMDEPGDEEIHKQIRKNLEIMHPKLKKGKDLGPETEVATLMPGETFGQAAIINEKPRYYTAICSEACVFLRLFKTDYLGLEGSQEKHANEKMEFLRMLNMFKTWSRISLYNLTFYFKEVKFRRAAKVYSEGDPANMVYIIKEGEFKFTQKFSINAGNILTATGKGSKTLKSAKGNTIRQKDLQIVTRQQGEVFGLEEILDKVPTRIFTCSCLSQTGKLLVISEKNFFKKITHPESVKFYEEQWKTFKQWVEPRLDKLKKLEVFKDDTSFTPYQKLKTDARASTTMVGERLRNFSEVAEDGSPLPLILKKIIVNRNDSGWKTAKRREASFTMFSTELGDKSMYGRDKMNRTGGLSELNDLVYAPARLLRGKIRKNKTDLV